MKTKLLLLLLLANFSIYAQYTNIPDINFENKLIALGIDTAIPDGKVQTDKIDKLTYLDISNSSIVDLTGIQDFVSLTTLYCYGNQLTSLDVSKNIALVSLGCSDNQLASLDVSMNTALKDLYCNSNQLTSLDISKNTALENLACENNQLATLDVSKNTAFKYLYCYSNQLTALDVSTNISLIELVCDSNQLTSLDVSMNTFLKLLFCSSNQLTTLDISMNTVLKNLYCTDNQLTTLDVSKNTALETLSCYSNQLTSLNVSKNTTLKDLYCYSNQLTTLDVSKNTTLISLFCGSNQLTNLNLKNGKNTFLNYMNCIQNSNLSCIQVDDISYSNTNWNKDATATYSLNCPSLGIAETVFGKIAVYPNPAKGELHIDNSTLEKATIYDTLGRLITITKFTNGSNNNTINLAGFRSGIYYIYLENEGATIVKKIIVE